jgi:hypothetical protein
MYVDAESSHAVTSLLVRMMYLASGFRLSMASDVESALGCGNGGPSCGQPTGRSIRPGRGLPPVAAHALTQKRSGKPPLGAASTFPDLFSPMSYGGKRKKGQKKGRGAPLRVLLTFFHP